MHLVTDKCNGKALKHDSHIKDLLTCSRLPDLEEEF